MEIQVQQRERESYLRYPKQKKDYTRECGKEKLNHSWVSNETNPTIIDEVEKIRTWERFILNYIYDISQSLKIKVLYLTPIYNQETF